MKGLRIISLAAGLSVAVVIVGTSLRSSNQPARTPPPNSGAAWASAATRACWTIQNRISAHGWEHWEPLARQKPPLDRVAALRRELLRFQETALRDLRARGTPPTNASSEAMQRYEHTLATTREVIRAAAHDDAAEYIEADIRMRRSILRTRAAFQRAGAENICNFAI